MPWHLEFSNSIPRHQNLKPGGVSPTFHVVLSGHYVHVNYMKVGEQELCMGSYILNLKIYHLHSFVHSGLLLPKSQNPSLGVVLGVWSYSLYLAKAGT